MGELGELGELRRRLELVEAAVAELRGRRPPAPAMAGATGPGWRAEARPLPELEPAAADAYLREALPALMAALRALARERNDRLLFVAAADARTGGSGSPQSVRALAEADLAGPLARLAAAAGSVPRARILQALALGEERTTAELGAASRAAGGNLYQHLNALHRVNLLYQPGRGRYRLTANGQYAVELLLCSALQARTAPPPELEQGQWFGPQEPKGSGAGERRAPTMSR